MPEGPCVTSVTSSPLPLPFSEMKATEGFVFQSPLNVSCVLYYSHSWHLHNTHHLQSLVQSIQLVSPQNTQERCYYRNEETFSEKQLGQVLLVL